MKDELLAIFVRLVLVLAFVTVCAVRSHGASVTNFTFTVVGSTSTNSTTIFAAESGSSQRSKIRLWFTNSFHIAFGSAATTNSTPIQIGSAPYIGWNEDEPNCWQGSINARAFGTNSFSGSGIITYK